AVDISSRVSSYTAARTHTASIRTSVDTHAPLLTKDLAAATCFRSSRVIRCTRTLVSMVCMFFLHIPLHAFIELFHLLRGGRSLGKDCSVNILRRIPTGFPHDHCVAFLIPFQD